MPTATGSLADVQARAARLQRRRTAMRGSAGVFALAVVAAIGAMTVRGGSDDFAISADADDAAADAASMTVDAALPAEELSRAEQAGADEAAFASTASAEMAEIAAAETETEESDAAAVLESAPMTDRDAEPEAVPAGDDAAGEAEGDEPGLRSGAGEAGIADEGDSAGAAVPQLPPTISPQDFGTDDDAVFAPSPTVVSPPTAAAPAEVRYFLSGGFALAQAGDDWFAYNGAQWQQVAPPEPAPAEPVRGGRSAAGAVVLAETMLLGVTASVEVYDGVGWLTYGQQRWEIGPIPDASQAHAQIGWIGAHLAVVVGAAEQSLYILERLE